MTRLMLMLAALSIAAVAVVGCPVVPCPAGGPLAGPVVHVGPRGSGPFAKRGR